MALHRDIYWVGRQWAVTGFGIQAVDQRLKGAFDIDLGRVWEEGLTGPLRELGWFNEADFEKALKVARERFPDPPRTAGPPAMLPASEPDPSASDPAAPASPPTVARLHLQGPLAKFLPQWRIRR